MPLLPDPQPAERRFPVISVDDHLIEPPDLFEGRMPAHLAERAPRVVDTEDGAQAWAFEGNFYPNIGLNAVAGRPKSEWSMEPARFDEMRKGCWDIHARIADMDAAGVWASLCFPSLIAGFAGAAFSRARDAEVGLACVRAWNDWHHEVWAGTYPRRIIPLQITWINDPDIAAEEVRRNAARGFKALSFPESPVNLGLPSLHSAHWDPLLQACEETKTVVCLHTGSAGSPSWAATQSAGAPLELATTLFPVNACTTAADWLWARIPLRFPQLDVALSEGGIGWVPMLLDRLDYVSTHSASGMANAWDGDISPSAALRRNFWFCTIDDPSTLALRDRIGVDHIMLEVDYPHADSTWPETQSLLADRLAGVGQEDVDKMTHVNAAKLFRHPLPPAAWATGGVDA
ncbi:MAG: putative TIM-barrel fold metal-dependent hydrolase [Acidimicrobiales bacterium]|jgi:predicted TIM-barrel fold metal-dependent hydrolase|nr:putative TIM-barrel fold metal-dependent hydrolase [Acidimicrobiales bacterium]